jgi:ATP sulfurylase
MGGAVAYRVGGYPSAIAAIAMGTLTPLEGFFRAAIVAFGSAKDLHVGHIYIVKLAKFAQASPAMQGLVGEFKALCKLCDCGPGLG